MKGKLLSMIKILGVGLSEIALELDLDEISINTIEIDGDNIILHTFDSNMDIETSFDDLSIFDQKKVYSIVSCLLYN